MKHLYLVLTLMLFSIASAFGQESCPSTNATGIVNGGVKTIPNPTREVIRNLTPPPPNNNDRIIYWCHGLGGDPTSWARVGGATQSQAIGQTVPGYPPRKVTSLYPTYQQFSFSSAAGTLHNTMIVQGDPVCAANGITDKTVNFAIGHSQGGLAIRATDKMLHDDDLESQRRFGGMVTFATAHQGAMILNNEALLYQMGEEGCKALAGGPIEKELENVPFLNLLIPNKTIADIKNGLCELVSDYILPVMFKEQNQPITEDYKVGAPALSNLNGYTSELPKVAFYGIEEEPVFYRLMYSLNVKKPNEFNPFEADPDNEVVDKFTGLLSNYKAEYEQYKMEVGILEGMGLPCNLVQWLGDLQFCLQWNDVYKKKLSLRDRWKEGYDWLLESNNQWKIVIGARIPHLIQYTAYECQCDTYDASMQWLSSYSYPVSDPSDCESNSGSGTECNVHSFPVFITEYEEKASDGVVLVESASDFSGAPNVAMLKSNHQQLRNDTNTKACMLGVLDGDHGQYFKTKIR